MEAHRVRSRKQQAPHRAPMDSELQFQAANNKRKRGRLAKSPASPPLDNYPPANLDTPMLNSNTNSSEPQLAAADSVSLQDMAAEGPMNPAGPPVHPEPNSTDPALQDAAMAAAAAAMAQLLQPEHSNSHEAQQEQAAGREEGEEEGEEEEDVQEEAEQDEEAEAYMAEQQQQQAAAAPKPQEKASSSGSRKPGTKAPKKQGKKKAKGSSGIRKAGLCNVCGERDSPLWRKGPAGTPWRRLCNACGMRYSRCRMDAFSYEGRVKAVEARIKRQRQLGESPILPMPTDWDEPYFSTGGVADNPMFHNTPLGAPIPDAALAYKPAPPAAAAAAGDGSTDDYYMDHMDGYMGYEEEAQEYNMDIDCHPEDTPTSPPAVAAAAASGRPSRAASAAMAAAAAGATHRGGPARASSSSGPGRAEVPAVLEEQPGAPVAVKRGRGRPRQTKPEQEEQPRQTQPDDCVGAHNMLLILNALQTMDHSCQGEFRRAAAQAAAEAAAAAAEAANEGPRAKRARRLPSRLQATTFADELEAAKARELERQRSVAAAAAACKDEQEQEEEAEEEHDHDEEEGQARDRRLPGLEALMEVVKVELDAEKFVEEADQEEESGQFSDGDSPVSQRKAAKRTFNAAQQAAVEEAAVAFAKAQAAAATAQDARALNQAAAAAVPGPALFDLHPQQQQQAAMAAMAAAQPAAHPSSLLAQCLAQHGATGPLAPQAPPVVTPSIQLVINMHHWGQQQQQQQQQLLPPVQPLNTQLPPVHHQLPLPTGLPGFPGLHIMGQGQLPVSAGFSGYAGLPMMGQGQLPPAHHPLLAYARVVLNPQQPQAPGMNSPGLVAANAAALQAAQASAQGPGLQLGSVASRIAALQQQAANTGNVDLMQVMEVLAGQHTSLVPAPAGAAAAPPAAAHPNLQALLQALLQQQPSNHGLAEALCNFKAGGSGS